MARGTALPLANGSRLTRRRIMGADRVEIEEPADASISVLKRIDCTVEIVLYRARAVAPAAHVLDRAFERWPIHRRCRAVGTCRRHSETGTRPGSAPSVGGRAVLLGHTEGRTMITSGPIVEHGNGNVFTDLGHPEADAHLLKADLVSRIDTIIQTEAARLLGGRLPQAFPGAHVPPADCARPRHRHPAAVFALRPETAHRCKRDWLRPSPPGRSCWRPCCAASPLSSARHNTFQPPGQPRPAAPFPELSPAGSLDDDIANGRSA